MLILIGAQMNIKWMLFAWIHCEHWNLWCLPVNQGGDVALPPPPSLVLHLTSLFPGLGKSLNLIGKKPLMRDLLMIFHYLIMP